jgi:hypothetical protein
MVLEDAVSMRDTAADYRAVFDAMPYPVCVVDPQSSAVLDANDAARRMYGYSADEFRRLSMHELLAPGTTGELVLDAPAASHDGVRAQRHRTRTGTILDVEVTTRPVALDGRAAWLVAIADVSARTRLEEQLRQAQKMEAVGRLAGGVAHDFNNLLIAISGYSELAGARPSLDDKGRWYLEQVTKAAGRAAALTRRLLAFSRKQVLQPGLLDLNAIVADMEKMLRRLIGDGIELTIDVEPGLGLVLADLHEVEQVVMNLVVNSRDAISANGRISISTRNAADAPVGSQHGPARDVLLIVSDNGCGMSEEVRRHLFEPFFTTKEPGKGTGLGLSTVHAVVQQSGGHIAAASAPGMGTTFTIAFPRVEAGPRPAGEPPTDLAATPSRLRAATVLVVDSDDAVRELATLFLGDHGHIVLPAASGSEASRIAERHAGVIDLLIADETLPGVGTELATWLEALYPEIRVVSLLKPFTSASLADRVREALDG